MNIQVCEYCDNEFSCVSSLILHKKTAKYCLIKQGIYIDKYQQCSFCRTIFSTKTNLDKHNKICNNRIIDELKCKLTETEILLQDYEEKFIFMQADIEDLKRQNHALNIENAKLSVYKEEYTIIRDKPTTTTNTNSNTVNNNTTTNNKLKLVNTATIDPFTVDLVKTRLEGNEYTYAAFLLGENGIKRFILDMITKDDEKNYVTTDVSRSNFHRFKETRKWGLDAGAKFLTNVFNEMKPLVKQYWAKFNAEADNAKSPEEHESFDVDRDKIKPIVLAIDGPVDSRFRNELLGNVVKHIKPHVAV